MTAVLLPEGRQQFFTTTGVPAVGYKLMTWAAGTSTPQVTWADALKVSANPNPIILDARGEAVIFWDGAYKIQLLDATGAPVQPPVDNVQTAPPPSVSQIPSVDNALTLGSPTFSWANLYLGANHAPVLDPVSGNFGYYKRTSAEITAGITPTNFSYPFLQPERYGAVGDGVTDDTVAFNSLISVLNISPGATSTWQRGATYFVGPLSPITAANITVNAYATLKAKPVTTFGHTVTVNAANVVIRGLTINGNQAAFAAPGWTAGMIITANNPTLEDCTITQCSSSWGLTVDSFTTTNVPIVGGTLLNCNFTNNAGLGFLLDNVCYFNVVNALIQNNGWNFQGTFAQNTVGLSFGVSVRFRSHHINFVNCSAMQNGRDGININQGAYAIKLTNFLAWMNGDGGITQNGDNTATGRVGEGEPAQDIELIDCESYNNWAGGFVAQTTCYNLTILGGRYYNNGRGCGTRAIITSMPSGVMMNAQGSLGAVIKTKCYDDRQLCVITAAAAGVITATGWVSGSAANYPRVALYNAALAFQGYGTITVEAAGSVTITAAAFNGVALGSIAAGWFVTQRVQHNGCYIGTGNQGTVDIDGFGNLPGPFVDYGYKVFSNSPSSGQNVRNVNPELAASPELLANPSFDSGIGSGTTWTYAIPGGGTASAFSTAGPKLYSPAGLVMAGGTSNATADGILITNGSNYLVDCWFEVSCTINAVNAGDAGIVALYGAGLSTQIFHPGGGTKRMTIGGYLLGANALTLRLFTSSGKTAWFDEASVKVKFEPVDSRDYSYPTRNLAV